MQETAPDFLGLPVDTGLQFNDIRNQSADAIGFH